MNQELRLEARTGFEPVNKGFADLDARAPQARADRVVDLAARANRPVSVRPHRHPPIAEARRVLARVCEQANVLPDELISESRDRHLARVRRTIMNDLRERGYTLTVIGSIVVRHYTTVIQGLRAIKR